MKRRHGVAVTLGIALITWLPTGRSVQASAPTSYTVTNLGSIDGIVPTITGLNASGQLSGYASTSSGPRAVFYAGGTWQYVPGLATIYSVATGINAKGDLSGWEFGTAGIRAFLYVNGSSAVTLFSSTLTNGTMTFGEGIDDNDDVVGWGDTASGTLGWLVTGGTTSLTPLPLLSNGTTGQVCGINTAGAIVGFSTTGAGVQHAYRINADLSTDDASSLDGPAGSSTACAIDDNGRIGGNSSNAGATNAFRFDSGVPVNIDDFGSTNSSVDAVSAGVSVGFYTTSTGDSRAFVQNGTDPAVDLTTLMTGGSGWVLSEAQAVNTAGAIAGDGLLNGAVADFLLTPVLTDTTPPTITALSATPSTITPPNGAQVPVTVSATATDNVDPSPVCSIASISTSGPSTASSSITGPLTASVSATGGTTYTFNVTCSDASGNQAHGTTAVVVPPDTTPPVISSVTASPSSITPPLGQMVTVTIAVAATDNSGVAPACSLSSITPGTSGVDYALTGQFTGSVKAVGGRTYTLTARCIDGAGNASTASVNVVVPPDTTPPVISSVSATPSVIWPPDNTMVNVSVTVSATDNVDPTPACTLTGVSGSPANATITGPLSASVRATKGNVYTLTVTCSDEAGNKTSATTTVTVPHDQGGTVSEAFDHREDRDRDRDGHHARGDHDGQHHDQDDSKTNGRGDHQG